MNGLFIAVIIILAIFALIGYWRGFIRTVFSLVSYILLIGLVSWFSPHVTTFLEENTSIHSVIQEKCIEGIKIETNKKIDNKVEDTEPIVIAGIVLPEEIQKQLLEKTGDAADNLLESSGIYDQIGNYVAGFVLNGIAFFVTFVLVSIILRLAVNMLDLVSKLPVIKGVNHTLGIVAGLLEGLVIVWLMLFVIAIINTTDIGKQLMNYINESQLLQFLYEYNPILSLIQHFFQI